MRLNQKGTWKRGNKTIKVHKIAKALNLKNYNLICFLFKYDINLLMKEWELLLFLIFKRIWFQIFDPQNFIVYLLTLELQ